MLPCRGCLLQCWMRHEQVPHDSLKCLGMWSHALGIDRRYHNDCLSEPRREAAVASDDTNDHGSDLARVLERLDQVGTDVRLAIAAAHRQDEYDISLSKPAAFQRRGKYRAPAVIVRACRQLGHVISGRIRLESGQLAKVVDRVRA